MLSFSSFQHNNICALSMYVYTSAMYVCKYIIYLFLSSLSSKSLLSSEAVLECPYQAMAA